MKDHADHRRLRAARFLEGMRRHRFVSLLGALIALLLSTPLVRLLRPGVHPWLAHVTVSVLFAAMLLSAVFAACRSRRSVIVAMCLAMPAFLLQELGLLLDWNGVVVTAHLFSIAFLAYTVAVILKFLFASQRVTFNTIAASLCVYLLLGVLWANAYSLIDILQPDSFHFAFAGDDEGPMMRFGGRHSVFPIYYSFVTLSTLGYGDIIPNSSPARLFAAVEAIVGQLYLAVLVARLVGLHISQSAASARSGDPAPDAEQEDVKAAGPRSG